METIDISSQMNAEAFVRAREIVQIFLSEWNSMTWDELLSDDVVLTLRLGAVGIDEVGEFDLVGGNLQVLGREDAKQVLTSIDPELSGGLSVTTELVGEYDVALLGNWVMPPTEEDPEMLSLPIVVYVAFDDEGKIEEMTIAALDLQPLTEAIRAGVKDGAAQASA